MHISPQRSRRRASLAAERRGKRTLIGFNARGSHSIVDMQTCLILRPELFALVEPLAHVAVAARQGARRLRTGGVGRRDRSGDRAQTAIGSARARSPGRIRRGARHRPHLVALRPARRDRAGGPLAVRSSCASGRRWAAVWSIYRPAAFCRRPLKGEAALVKAVMAALSRRTAARSICSAATAPSTFPAAARGTCSYSR